MFYKMWIVRAARTKAPLLLLRYEDLSNPARYPDQLLKLHTFMYRVYPFRGMEMPSLRLLNESKAIAARNMEEKVLTEYLKRSKEFQQGEHAYSLPSDYSSLGIK